MDSSNDNSALNVRGLERMDLIEVDPDVTHRQLVAVSAVEEAVQTLPRAQAS